VKMHGENNKLRIQVRESAFAKWALKAWWLTSRGAALDGIVCICMLIEHNGLDTVKLFWRCFFLAVSAVAEGKCRVDVLMRPRSPVSKSFPVRQLLCQCQWCRVVWYVLTANYKMFPVSSKTEGLLLD
jgi:hypothetical protein